MKNDCSALVSLHACADAFRRSRQAGGDYFVYAGTLHEPDSEDHVRVEGDLRVALRFEDRHPRADRPCRRNRQSRARVGAARTAAFSMRSNWVRGTPEAIRQRVCDRSPHGRAEVPQQGRRARPIARTRSCSIRAASSPRRSPTTAAPFSVFGVEPDGKLTEAFYTRSARRHSR